MTSEQTNRSTFKYNLSFYYQSTIVYFVVFLLYTIIRGEFVEDSFTLITKDPIIYFFAIIVLISIVSLLYNLYKNRHLEIGPGELIFSSRGRIRKFTSDQITEIRISRRRKRKGIFRMIRIRLKERRRPVLIRPSDYENDELLVKKFQELKAELEKK